MGRIGQQIELGDFRDVAGMLIPFQATVTIANPLIGTILSAVDSFELGGPLAEGTFQLAEVE